MKNILTVPNVREAQYSFDLISRMLDDRIIMLFNEVNADTCQMVIAQLLYLESKAPGKEIQLLLDCPGGSVHSGLGVIDTMNFITSPVHTVVIGLAASMGFMFAINGSKRSALPNAQLMAHAVSSGTKGTIHDQSISLDHTKKLNRKLMEIIASKGKVDLAKVKRQCQRDWWMDSQEALGFGFIDKIVSNITDL